MSVRWEQSELPPQGVQSLVAVLHFEKAGSVQSRVVVQVAVWRSPKSLRSLFILSVSASFESV